jgi:hypothetical protein
MDEEAEKGQEKLVEFNSINKEILKNKEAKKGINKRNSNNRIIKLSNNVMIT